MSEVDLKEMLEAGVHFGHKKDKWNPKMRPFIFTDRNGIYIFDLTKTKDKLEEAQKFAAKLVNEGGKVLFVGTKKQIQGVVKEAAEKAEMPYLVERWPGGMLTNFSTILARLKYLRSAEEKSAAGKTVTKKEALNLKRKIEKLNEVFEGVKEMRQVPDALFIADVVKENIAVREAKKIGIPVIGIVDTNANPNIEYPIPGNDDAVRAVQYISSKIAEVIARNKKEIAPNTEETDVETASDKSDKEIKGKEEKIGEATKEPEVVDEAEKKLEKLEEKAEEEVVVKKSKPKDSHE